MKKTFKQMRISRSILAAILTVGTAGPFLVVSLAQTREEVREEFHKTYPLAPGGRLSLSNINGSVHISSWDRNEVKVDAVKHAYTREVLAEAEIVVDAGPEAINIKTKYANESLTFSNSSHDRYDNPASVEYTLVVPATVRLDSAELINGSIDIQGITGRTSASSINGGVNARDLRGETKLSTINGQLEARFERLDESKAVSLTSVNGSVSLTIPSDTNAILNANTVFGGIKNDFGLKVHSGDYVGHHLAGAIGRGGPRIKIGNVNGGISIHHAQDGRTVSPATDSFSEHSRNDELDEAADLKKEAIEIANEAREAVGADIDTEKITRQAQRAAARAIRDSQRIQADALREVARSQRDMERMARDIASSHLDEHSGMSSRFTDRQSKSFSVTGVPRVTLGTFDGPMTIHGWDKSEVMFAATRRAANERQMGGINVRAEQRGDEISIVAEFDKSSVTHLRGFNSNASVALDVYVPRNTNLRASSGDGSLDLEGISGEIEARTGDGAINVHNGHGRILANTGDGSVGIINFDGEANVRTGDGAITLDGNFLQLAVQTGDGSIALALPSDSNVTIETNVENVSNRGLAVSEESGVRKGVHRWRIGSGGTVFTLRTGDGGVVLRPSRRPEHGPSIR